MLFRLCQLLQIVVMINVNNNNSNNNISNNTHIHSDGHSATDFLDRLGQMISAKTNEVRERMYLYQRICSGNGFRCLSGSAMHPVGYVRL